MPVSDARQRLLDLVAAYVADHGLSQLSLRDLAAAVGTSHRMLNYHFGSRAGLLAAIVEGMEAQQRVALDEIARTATAPSELLTRQWAGLTQASVLPFVRLFFEVASHAFHGAAGTEAFLDGLTAPWLDVARDIATRLDLHVADAEVLLGIAVVRGLLFEVLATGDVVAPTAAFERFIVMWEATRSAA
ncbi:MAG: helix-turn-helix domain-containing protein [Acidimicrobiia bacterium]